MYLTHRNVAELTNYLSKKKASLSAADKNTVAVLDQFLHNSHDEIAFLRIDLNLVLAGFKNTMDTEGTVQQLPWGPEQVRAVACWLDRFLTAQATIAQLHSQLEHNELTLTAARAQVSNAHELLASDTTLEALDTAYKHFTDRNVLYSQFATTGGSTTPFDTRYLNPAYVKRLLTTDGWRMAGATTQFSEEGWGTVGWFNTSYRGYAIRSAGKDKGDQASATTLFDDDILYIDGVPVQWSPAPDPAKKP